jgi:VanZ family protein
VDGRPNRARSLLALAIVVAAMAYLCLHPFRLRSPVPDLSLAALSWRHLAPGDLLSNIAFFVPFGAVLAWGLSPYLALLPRLLLVVLAALGLSLGFEVLQQLVPGRISSGIDVVLNVVGAVLGAPLARWLRWPRWSPSPAARQALWLAGAWLVLRLFPFRPSLRWRDWLGSLHDLLAADLPAWPAVAMFTAAYVALFVAVADAGRSRVRIALACAALAAAVLAGRLVIPALAGEPAELAGILLAAGLCACRGRLPPRLAGPALAVVVVGGLLVGVLLAGDWRPIGTALALEHRSDFVRGLAAAAFGGLAVWQSWARCRRPAP